MEKPVEKNKKTDAEVSDETDTGHLYFHGGEYLTEGEVAEEIVHIFVSGVEQACKHINDDLRHLSLETLENTIRVFDEANSKLKALKEERLKDEILGYVICGERVCKNCLVGGEIWRVWVNKPILRRDIVGGRCFCGRCRQEMM